MGAAGISHFGIAVTDLERSKRFYRDVIGLPIVAELEYEESPELLHYQDRRQRRYAYFATSGEPGAPVIVMGTTHPDDTSGPIMADQLGVHHLALWFADLQTLIRRLEAEDVPIFWGPWFIQNYTVDVTDPDRPPMDGVTMYFRDPDGICIQAEQRLTGNDEGYPVLYPDGPPVPNRVEQSRRLTPPPVSDDHQ